MREKRKKERLQRERKRETCERRERHMREEGETRREGEMESEGATTFKTLPCVRSKRSRVYLENARNLAIHVRVTTLL